MRDILDLKECIARGDYAWERAEEQGVCVARHVIFCQTPVTNHYQSMNIYAPMDYVNLSCSINAGAQVNGFSPADAPVIFRNNCGGWLCRTTWPSDLSGISTTWG